MIGIRLYLVRNTLKHFARNITLVDLYICNGACDANIACEGSISRPPTGGGSHCRSPHQH